MKIKLILVSVGIFFIGNSISQVGIGTITPVSSAELDVTSTTKGLLPPRMTQAQRNAIVSPVAGLLIWCSNCGTTGELQVNNGTTWKNMIGGTASSAVPAYPLGSVHCITAGAAIVDVTNPTTSKTWMDRNLGASQVAASSSDINSYGDLYQWGRLSDGHQCKTTSVSTITLSSTDNPGNTDFIKSTSTPYDWRSGQNGNLWQGASGTNNPCPSGYRIPTDTEWENERLSWVQAPISSTNTATGAFSSPLKLPWAGYRDRSNGSLSSAGSSGFYWSSTINATNSNLLIFNTNTAYMSNFHRAYGVSVRCIKD
jgi:uncharacterized protein (TIGR02145 family)